MKTKLKRHPNTIAALISSLGVGSLIVQAGARLGLHLDAQEGLYIAGGLTSVVLFVGRHGLVGSCRFVKKVILYGTRSTGP